MPLHEGGFRNEIMSLPKMKCSNIFTSHIKSHLLGVIKIQSYYLYHKIHSCSTAKMCKFDDVTPQFLKLFKVSSLPVIIKSQQLYIKCNILPCNLSSDWSVKNLTSHPVILLNTSLASIQHIGMIIKILSCHPIK